MDVETSAPAEPPTLPPETEEAQTVVEDAAQETAATAMDVDPSAEAEVDEETKKRKENPVSEEEALEDAGPGAPTRTKHPRNATSSSAGTPQRSTATALRESTKAKRESDRKAKEYAQAEREAKKAKEEEEKKQKIAEREAKKAAAEEAKQQKELSKQQKEEEKKKKEEEKEAEKKKKEEEKKRKEEEKLKAKEERDEAQRKKEAEKVAKQEEKAAKEEEKRKQKEEKDKEKERATLEKQKAETDAKKAAERQSTALLSFFKKTPTKSTQTVPVSDGDKPQDNDTESSEAQFQNVGRFLSWIPPLNAVVPKLHKWTSKVSEEEFEALIASSNTSHDDVLKNFNDWRCLHRAHPVLDALIEKRRAQFQHRPEFKDGATLPPRVQRQKEHLIKHRVKCIQFDPEESLRPLFYGTFTTSSTEVRGCKFLGRANGINYEIDSEEEDFNEVDEAEEDADDLEKESNGTDDSEAGDEPNEYEFDAFVVPDGHLSDGEEFSDDDSENGDEADEQKALRRAERARRLALAKNQVNNKMPKLTQLNPTLTGYIHYPETCPNAQLEFLKLHLIMPLVTPLPISTTKSAVVKSSKTGGTPARVIPTEKLPEVAATVHAKYQASFDKLLTALREAFPMVSKKQLSVFLHEKCEKTKTAAAKGGVWLVKRHLREEFGLPFDDPLPPATVSITNSLVAMDATKSSTESKSKTVAPSPKKTAKAAASTTPASPAKPPVSSSIAGPLASFVSSSTNPPQ